jgi:hypothetical protein
MEDEEARPELVGTSVPDGGHAGQELGRVRRLFDTPPTAVKPAAATPPRWDFETPTWREVVEYLLVGETDAAAAEGTPAEPLQPLNARAFEWRHTVSTRLDGGGLRRFQAEVLAHGLLGRDAFALAPTGSGKSLAFQLPSLAANLSTRALAYCIAAHSRYSASHSHTSAL